MKVYQKGPKGCSVAVCESIGPIVALAAAPILLLRRVYLPALAHGAIPVQRLVVVGFFLGDVVG